MRARRLRLFPGRRRRTEVCSSLVASHWLIPTSPRPVRIASALCDGCYHADEDSCVVQKTFCSSGFDDKAQTAPAEPRLASTKMLGGSSIRLHLALVKPFSRLWGRAKAPGQEPRSGSPRVRRLSVVLSTQPLEKILEELILLVLRGCLGSGLRR